MELGSDPFSWILLGIIIILVIVAVLLLVIRREELNRKPDFRTLFIVGTSWLPLGIAVEIWPLTIAGAGLMLYAGLNKRHWKTKQRWNDLPPVKRSIKLVVVAFLSAGVIAGLVVYMIQDKPIQSSAIYDELTPIYPDQTLENDTINLHIAAPRGAVIGGHILIDQSETGKTIRLNTRKLPASLAKKLSWFELLPVPVPENTGLDSRTEKFRGQTNPYVIRRAPFDIYEVIKPIELPIQSDNQRVALRFEIELSTSLEPGSYIFDILIGKLLNPTIHTVELQVYPVDIPVPGESKAKYINWHSNSRICSDHKIELWSDDYWVMLEKYGEMMVHGRQNTFWFHWHEFYDFDSTGQILTYHEDRLVKYIEILTQTGLQYIQGAPFARRIDWGTDAMILSLPGYVEEQIYTNSSKGQTIIADLFTPILGTMKAQAWTDRWFQGIFDEPTGEYVDRYQEIAEQLRQIYPEIHILEATMTTELTGQVDSWCPQVQEFQAHLDFFTERQNAGDEVWVYTCLIPGGPWINRLVDQERLRQVYVGWALARYNLNGFLHWGLNHHRGKPFTELVVQHGNETNYLPAGDSHIIYPGDMQPWSSQRFEAHRIGMEDYELLQALESHNPIAYQSLMYSLFRSFDNYEKEVSEYRKSRKELLVVLSEAQ